MDLEEAKKWVAANFDADTELTAHRLKDMVEKATDDAVFNADLRYAVKSVVKAAALLSAAALAIFALYTFFNISEARKAVDEEKRSSSFAVMACQNVCDKSLSEKNELIEQLTRDKAAALDHKAVLDEHIQAVAAGCRGR